MPKIILKRAFPLQNVSKGSNYFLRKKSKLIIHRESGSGGPVIDHLLFLSKTATNLEGMCIFRKNNYCLPLATKHNLEIFCEFKEIKQRNEVVKKA